VTINIDWKGQKCGIYRAPLPECYGLMPELKPLLDDFRREMAVRGHNPNDYIIDVKVHMLMPGQYPCIPGWHLDMVPRDKDNNQLMSKTCMDDMYMWVSGEPLPEFKEQFIKVQRWLGFTQWDWHRGTVAKEHGWRGFFRACPKGILQAASKHQWMRRHSQVYLDAENFKW